MPAWYGGIAAVLSFFTRAGSPEVARWWMSGSVATGRCCAEGAGVGGGICKTLVSRVVFGGDARGSKIVLMVFCFHGN